ncbi:MAG: hypothetical protein J5832_01665 [Clostridia bacterium]|nr:hypothetical protein [Clostridia bacterium]
MKSSGYRPRVKSNPSIHLAKRDFAAEGDFTREADFTRPKGRIQLKNPRDTARIFLVRATGIENDNRLFARCRKFSKTLDIAHFFTL